MRSSGRRAIVIGAGAGGLAAAIRLSVQGWSVRVFERNPYPGGKMSQFEKGGFSFDTGPSLFTDPGQLEALFSMAGESLKPSLSYRAVPLSCTYFYPNGKVIRAFKDRDQFAGELERQAGEPRANLGRYLDGVSKTYSRIGTLFTDLSLHDRAGWSPGKVWAALMASRPAFFLGSLHRYNRTSFSTPEVVQLFDRLATYNGSDPFRAPGILHLIAQLEHNAGVFYPEGGMIRITEALYRLALKKEVEVDLNSPVERIITDAGRVTGITVGGRKVEADVVVSNADVYFTHAHLLGLPGVARQLLNQERSSSAVIFFWGINREFAELGLHNILFSGDYPAEFDHIFRKGIVTDDPTVYINITSKMEAGQAPPGQENWFVMINAPSDRGQDWKALVAQLKASVIRKVNHHLQTDIRSFIVQEEIFDPPVLGDRTASLGGALYGSSSNSRLAAFMRPPNVSRKVKGLYFCGGTVHPGGGLPLVLKSAAIAAGMIEKRYGNA